LKGYYENVKICTEGNELFAIGAILLPSSSFPSSYDAPYSICFSSCFFRGDCFDQAPHISLELESWDQPTPEPYDYAKHSRFDMISGHPQGEITDDVHAREKWRHEHRQSPHPKRISFRGSQYSLTMGSSSSLTDYLRAYHWALMEFVRHLSHVSKQFRQELAGFFWARTRLIMAHWQPEAFLELLPLLRERPAICAGLKHLRLWYSPELTNFSGIVSKLSSLDVLERFELGLRGKEADMVDLAHKKGLFGPFSRHFEN
jgi:hypothetical protein